MRLIKQVFLLRNILFKGKDIKIADYGKSRQLVRTIKKLSNVTPFYMSPELFYEEECSIKTDIWYTYKIILFLFMIEIQSIHYLFVRSLGCVFYEIYYLEQAFEGVDFNDVKANVLNRKLRNINNDNNEITKIIDKYTKFIEIIVKIRRISSKKVKKYFNIIKDDLC